MRFERWTSRGWLLLAALSSATLAAQTLPSPLSEQAAVEIALARRSELAAAKHAIAVSAGAVSQAGVRQNPTLSIQTENWRFTGEPGFSAGRDLDIFAFVSQPIETGGKRGRRVELSRQGQISAELGAKAAEFRIRQNVRQAYWRARAADAKRQLLAENRDHFERIVTFHQVRFENGAIAEADVIKVRLERERLSAAAETAALEAERAQIDLPAIRDEIVRQTAGLGAFAAIGGAAAKRLARQALTGVGDAERAVHEHLESHRLGQTGAAREIRGANLFDFGD